MEEINETYRQHDIVARPLPAGFRGIVWKDGQKQFEAEGETLDEVVVQLKKHVDSTYVHAAQSRTEAPGAEEYVRAFRSIMTEISDGQFAMLKAHYQAPNMTLTSSQLADAAAYKGWSAANLHYGRLGFALHDHVPTVLPKNADGADIYTFVLATEGARSGPESEWQWKLRPEVASALETLGLNR